MPTLSGSGLWIWWLGNSHKANGEGRNHFSSAQVTGASSPMSPTPPPGETRVTDNHHGPKLVSLPQLGPRHHCGDCTHIGMAPVTSWPYNINMAVQTQTAHGPRWQCKSPISASSSLPSFLQFCFSPQCRNHSASSLPFPII